MTKQPTSIRKRNRVVVSFNAEKITIAVKKAFFEVTKDPHEQDAREITQKVVARIEGRAEIKGETYIPEVEEVQDLVELAIMEQGFFDVAKAYIIYRFEHEKIREEEKEEVQEKIEKHELFVTKQNGKKETFSVEKIRKAIARAAGGYEKDIDVEALITQCRAEVYDGIPTKDIAHVLTLVARSFIERDPAYSTVASRLLLQTVIYKDAVRYDERSNKSLETHYRDAFLRNVPEAVGLRLLDKRLLDFDLAKLAEAIDPRRDDLLKYMGTETLYDRYFVRDKRNPEHHCMLEAPQHMWMRVAMGLAINEEEKEKRAIEFYEMLSTLHFVSSTPTLFNAGTPHPQLSSCFLNVVDDSLESIFHTYSNNAQMSKWSGGVATAWSKLRGTGAFVKGGQMNSNGTVPFLKIADSVTTAISRSGRRRGATVVYLETWHYDIEDFLELRKNTGDDRRRTHDMNTANWIPDLFMKRVRADEEWTLFSPDEAPELPETYGREFEEIYARYEKMAKEGKMRLTKTVRARDLWKKMLTMLFETGHPWVTFKDPSNIRSPQDHVGVVHSSNLCTEITLNTSAEETAVCNLGSVNLAKHITDGALDRERIQKTVTTGMRMLDNVIDLNFYPIEEGKTSNLRHRPVGLGIMGFQDALYLQDIFFDSDECAVFASDSMEMISYYAILASTQLAQERGSYETYTGSKWDRNIFPVDTLALLEEERGEQIPLSKEEKLDWSVVREEVKKHGMRNSNCMAMAPTATIANIAGCFPTIEPVYKNIYVKSNISGEFVIVNPYLVHDLKQAGLWDKKMLDKLKGTDGDLNEIAEIPQEIKRKYHEVFDIDPMWMVRVAAERGKWIDQSQSFNLFYKGLSGSELSDTYMYAWKLGLKTTYYLRTLGASTVEKSTVALEQQQVESSVQHQAREAAAQAVAEVKESVLVAAGEKPSSQLKLCKIDDPSCESCQ